MAIFLNWRDSVINSKNRFITTLFSRVSSRWYPTNIIGSPVYTVFDAYAIQISSASIDANNVLKDTFLADARTGTITNSEYSKLYENFGVLYELPKMYSQYFDSFNSNSLLTSYRNQIRLFSDASFGGSSVQSFQRVGQAYTGISPELHEFVKKYEGWKLTCISGSVLQSGEDFIVTDKELPTLGNIVPKHYVEIDLSKYTYTLTKLGINTKIYSTKHVYSGLNATIYSSGSSSEFNGLITESFHNIVRADQYVIPSYSNLYSYWRPGDYPQIFPTSSIGNSVQLYQDYIQNTGMTKTVSVTGSVISLPSNYNSYDWQYDWIVRTYNDATYKMYVRWYPSSDIPDSVYYTQVNATEDIKYLSFSAINMDNFDVVETPGYAQMEVPYEDTYLDFMIVSPRAGIHYIFNNFARADDTSGNGAILHNPSPPTGAVLKRGRHTSQLVPFQNILNMPQMAYTGSCGYYQRVGTPFFFEFWAQGVDNMFKGNSYIQFKKQDSPTNLLTKGSIQNNGWCTFLDVSTFKMGMSTSSGVVYSSADISNLLSEEPSRWHYFAGTYCSGSIYLYIDGVQKTNTTIGETTAEFLTSGSLGFIISGDCNAGVDELAIQQGFLSPDTAMINFENSKPRLTVDSVMYSGSIPQYHQPKIVMNAQGGREIEWHEFSIRALASGTTYIS